MYTFSFAAQYDRLEERFRQQADKDGRIFLPNIPPLAPVDFIFIAMEPSLVRWAKSSCIAQNYIRLGFRDFAYSVEDFILHFSIRKFLCVSGETYHITDISKGAMLVKDAGRDRQERYNRWSPLLREEIRLVAKPNASIFAIGQEAERFLQDKGFPRLAGTLLHYSGQASKFRGRAILGREQEFKRFSSIVSMGDIKETAKEIMTQIGTKPPLFGKIMAHFEKSELSTSRKQLIFTYKITFEEWRQARVIESERRNW